MARISDLTFRQSKNKNNPLSAKGEYIANVAQRLFHMIPGEDEYNPGMGLNVNNHSRQPYENGQRDSEYETEITRQFQQYTDIIPTTVVAIYLKETLYIVMNVQYSGAAYQIQMNSTMGTLAQVVQGES